MASQNQKNLLIPGAVLIGFIILAASLIWAFNAFTFRIGTLDTERINKESTFVQGMNKELQAKGKELSAKLQTAKTDAEKSQINAEFQKYQADKNKIFTDSIRKATAKVAKAKGVKAVSSSQIFIYSQVDLTDAVIAELDK